MVLRVCTPGTIDEVVLGQNQYALAISIGIVVLLTCVLIASKPNISPFSNNLRP